MSQNTAGRAAAIGTFGGTVSFIWSQAIWPWLAPIGAPVVAALLGWAQGAPIMYVWVGTCLAFAAATTGVLRLEEWLARRRVEDKLVLAQCRFARHVGGGGNFALGFAVNNRADFPIQFEIEDLRTQIDNRVPPPVSGPISPRRVTVSPGGVGWWDDQLIKISPPRPGVITGEIEFRIRYGRVGRPRYKLSGRHRVSVQFSDAGEPGPLAWIEVVS